MILSAQSSDRPEVRISAKGNFSLGAGGLLRLLLALGVVTLSLAGFLAWKGYWPILFIAMIQVVLVTWLLTEAWKRAWVSELIVVGPDRITVLHQRYKRLRSHELDSAWAVVELRQPQVAWYGPEVWLRSREVAVQLGRFLTPDERTQLAASVREAVRKHSALHGAYMI